MPRQFDVVIERDEEGYHVASADRSDCKLLADLSREAIVDLGVARDGSFRANGRVDVDRVTAALAVQFAPLVLQMRDQRVPLHARGVPT